MKINHQSPASILHDIVDCHDHEVLVVQVSPANTLRVPPLKIASQPLQFQAAADERFQVQLSHDASLVVAPSSGADKLR